MIKYTYFTRREAIEWQKQNPIDPRDPLTDIHNAYYEFCDMNQLVAIVAFDGDRVIGRNLFFHCPISVNGKLIECVVTNNLYVDPAYRPKGIGTYLKMYVLKLGYPQISSGVSPEMRKVYDAWSAYRKIDASPVYSIPTDLMGLIRLSRLACQNRGNDSRNETSVSKAGFTRFSSMTRFLTGRCPPLRCLKPEDAVQMLDTVIESVRFTVQVPWNRDLLVNALHGRNKRRKAWIIEFPDFATQGRYLVTGYMKPRQIRTFGKKQKVIDELHLHEIFPPIRDDAQALASLKFAVWQARKFNASVLQVYAMTNSLQQVCQEYQFDKFFNKRVYIAPNTRDEELIRTLTNPDNWWCRAINEDQFEENALSRAGLIRGEQ